MISTKLSFLTRIGNLIPYEEGHPSGLHLITLHIYLYSNSRASNRKILATFEHLIGNF